ncbi:ThiF family adenylyltransferase [Corynebacterium halotolerans]|uniref:Molybdopterin biosynthesis protein MoeB n=1 Tax=Corynebacterium halotolerans YIM 70093 = DSM 44683 TaxID=1121362 RepID=M1NUU5_9CORY|nr:ThiF family adenylyltransferase [Corynebacterium halotolerans]AGF71285.1 molybdopterin biosynthesis protein MoeB [Corynebacterium halotolerans YIM 70093 = DSM 44683]
MTLNPRQIARYRRQITLGGFGPEGQRKLLDAHVAVVGAGGLGSPALLYLAGAGVGQVTLIDDDVVDLSNLHRQVIHTTDRVGELKGESAREQMLALNPELSVELFTGRLNRDNAVEVLKGAHVVMDGTDNFDTRHVVSAACAELGVPHVWASILGFDAQLTVFWAGHGPVYEDLFPVPPAPGEVPSCAQAGVLGPVVGVVGSAMAMETLKLVTGIGEPLVGQLGYYSSLTGRWEYIPVAGRPETVEKLLAEGPPAQARPIATPGPAAVAEVDEVPDNAVLIDVREPEEYANFRIPGGVNVPLGRIVDGFVPEELREGLVEGQPVVVYCAGGVRSAQAVRALEETGVTGPVSLAGGIDAWLDRQG